VVAKYVKEEGLNVIIITVGKLKNMGDIERIVKASKDGMHISAHDVSSIEKAFSQVAEIINRGNVNIETL